jgi:hypothetical protein
VEAERYQLAAGGQAFAGSQEERDPGPPPVVDLDQTAAMVSVCEPGATPGSSW